MTDQIRRAGRWLGPLVLVAAAAACGACGSSTTGASDTGTIGVETSQRFVTIENKAGMPLTEIKVEVVPVGGQTVFTVNAYRLEGGEKRDFGISQFTGRDGTPLNLRVVKPQLVRVKATDVNGKPHLAEVRWR